MRGGALGYLTADGHDRIKGGHGLLKDHGDLASPQTAESGRAQTEQVDWRSGRMRIGSAPENLSTYPSHGVEQAEDGQSGCALAGAGLADQAQNFALVDVQINASDRLGRAEMDLEIADVEERRHGASIRIRAERESTETS
jgi:hypothetical protein